MINLHPARKLRESLTIAILLKTIVYRMRPTAIYGRLKYVYE